MANVTISELRKTYGTLETIHGVSFEIPDGSFVALVGPSGCGKSTILRMIAGLEEITGGTISIDGEVVNEVEPKNRDIAMVFQNYALYPHMTVAQNMGFSMRLLKKSKAEIAKAVEEAAQILGLGDLLDRYPKQLSGGQRQRVAMGRAIVRHPKVFLFDEPLSNLDAKLRVQMRAELKAMHRRLGATIVHVTHDQIEAMTMADIVVVMEAGRVVQVGRPMQLYDRPCNLFVAGFIGSPAMNFLEAGLTQGSDLADLGGGDRLRLPVKAGATGNVVLGMRPEHLDLAGAGEGFAMELANVEPTGADTFIQGHREGTEITVQLRERKLAAPGEVLRFTVAPENIHLFDAASGDRIEL